MSIQASPAPIAAPSSRRIRTALTEAFLAGGRMPVCQAAQGQILTHESAHADHALLVLNGWIALSKTLMAGDTEIIDVMLPGDFALIGTRIVPVAACTVEALSKVEYIIIRPDTANGPDAASTNLREVLAASILTTQARFSELLLRLGRSNAANRIAYALLEFHTRLQAVGLTNGAVFEFPITQHKFGELTGLTNVHVCRTMRRLERDGIIAHPAPDIIELKDMNALCALADIDLDLFRKEILINRPVHAIHD